MMRIQPNMTQHSRRLACTGAGSHDAAAVAVAGVVVVLETTLFTAKQINPRWASGGLLMEGTS
jgi:hypothetical protein